MIGALLLACAFGAWAFALFGAWPAQVGVPVAMMFAGLSFALVPWWNTGARPVPAEVTSGLPEPEIVSERVEDLIEPAQVVEPRQAGIGSVPAMMPDILTPVPGAKTEIRHAYEAYARACQHLGHRAVSPVEFVPLMQTLCQMLGIRAVRRGRLVYLLDVRVN